jgi:hypothetical protein
LAALLWSGLAAAAAPPAGAVMAIEQGPELALNGVGQLMFGEQLQWRLVIEPAPQLRKGDGVKLGGVMLESADGKVRYRLADSGGYSTAENGGACKIARLGVYAIIRCDEDYVLNTVQPGPPVKIWPQFNDHSGKGDVPAEVANLPLPWWRPGLAGISGTHLIFLDYGSTNYGAMIESSEIPIGPALFDLATGQIALARKGAQADAPLYDQSDGPERNPAATPGEGDRVTAISKAGGRTAITVSTTFGLCSSGEQPPCGVGQTFESSGRRPLTYVFEARP